MLDFLDKIKVVEESNYHNLMTNEVEPYLEKRRENRYFFSADGKKLHCEVYEKLLSRGSIVVLHGFTESAEKFREMSYYFRKAGYSVYALDLRGHGKSHHDSDNPLRVDIESFDLYAEDINTLVETIVAPASKAKRFTFTHILSAVPPHFYI